MIVIKVSVEIFVFIFCVTKISDVDICAYRLIPSIIPTLLCKYHLMTWLLIISRFDQTIK